MTKTGQFTLWSLRTLLMIAVGCLFIGTAATSTLEDIGGWIARGLVALTGVMVFYVEAWTWYHRLRNHRGKASE